jgi:ribonuclease HI
MQLHIYTDGGSKGNPGPASIGIIMSIDGKEVYRERADIGIDTNNVAEYTAFCVAAERIPELLSQHSSISDICFFSDSQLMVEQLNGRYKVKNPTLALLHSRAKGALSKLPIPYQIQHVLRDKNTLADALVNDAL